MSISKFPEKPPADVASFAYMEWENRKLSWELTHPESRICDLADAIISGLIQYGLLAAIDRAPAQHFAEAEIRKEVYRK